MSLHSLDTLASNVNLVINYPKNFDFHKLVVFKSELNNIGYFYYFINHDKDIDENGKTKTLHSHLILQCPKRHQLKYYIRFVSTALEIQPTLVSIDVCESLPLSIQYLIHKNDISKTQYLPNDIDTNITYDLLESYLNQSPTQFIDFQYLCKLIDDSLGNRLYIIKHIGIKQYNDLRNTINDIIRDKVAYGSDFLKHCNDDDLPF